MYSSDVGKMIGCPVLHVNGDHPEVWWFYCASYALLNFESLQLWLENFAHLKFQQQSLKQYLGLVD